jgi:hypothetical protein
VPTSYVFQSPITCCSPFYPLPHGRDTCRSRAHSSTFRPRVSTSAMPIIKLTGDQEDLPKRFSPRSRFFSVRGFHLMSKNDCPPHPRHVIHIQRTLMYQAYSLQVPFMISREQQACSGPVHVHEPGNHAGANVDADFPVCVCRVQFHQSDSVLGATGEWGETPSVGQRLSSRPTTGSTSCSLVASRWTTVLLGCQEERLGIQVDREGRTKRLYFCPKPRGDRKRYQSQKYSSWYLVCVHHPRSWMADVRRGNNKNK